MQRYIVYNTNLTILTACSSFRTKSYTSHALYLSCNLSTQLLCNKSKQETRKSRERGVQVQNFYFRYSSMERQIYWIFHIMKGSANNSPYNVMDYYFRAIVQLSISITLGKNGNYGKNVKNCQTVNWLSLEKFKRHSMVLLLSVTSFFIIFYCYYLLLS